MIVQGRSGQWVEKDVVDLTKRISPSVAQSILTNDVTECFVDSQLAIQQADSLLIKPPGLGIQKRPAKLPENAEDMQALQQRVQEAYAAVERSLDLLAVAIKESTEQQKLFLTAPFLLAAGICVCMMLVLIIAVLRDAKAGIFGSGGAFTFALGTAFYQMNKYNQQRLALDVLVPQLKVYLGTCRPQDLLGQIDCIKKLQGSMNQYFGEIRAIALQASSHAPAKATRPDS